MKYHWCYDFLTFQPYPEETDDALSDPLAKDYVGPLNEHLWNPYYGNKEMEGKYDREKLMEEYRKTIEPYLEESPYGPKKRDKENYNKWYHLL